MKSAGCIRPRGGRKLLIAMGLFLALMLHAGTALGQKAGSAQQIAVMKTLKPGVVTVAVFSSTIDEKGIESWTRAGMSLGVKVVVAKPKAMADIAGLYRSVVKEKSAQMILIPDASDELMTGVGFEYLRETVLADQVGILAPQEAMVSNGALCFVTTENGKLKVFVNQRIAQVIGANVPSEPGASVTYVVR